MTEELGNFRNSQLFFIPALARAEQARIPSDPRSFSRHPLPGGQVLRRRSVQAGRGDHPVPVLPAAQTRRPPGKTSGLSRHGRGTGGTGVAM